MTVIDTSVIIAIINNEPDAQLYIDCLKKNKGNMRISSVSVLEVCIVASRVSSEAVSLIHSLLDIFAIHIVEFNNEQAYLAARAYQKYGKGNRQTKLNFGDCAAYALATYLNANLLSKGDDFVHIDMTPVIH